MLLLFDSALTIFHFVSVSKTYFCGRYRFVNILGWDKKPFLRKRQYYSTYDNAPAHGGNQMGYTILLTNGDSSKVKKYDPDEYAYVGPQVSTLNVLNDKIDAHRIKAHEHSRYKDRIIALDSNNNDVTSNGFSQNKWCDIDEQCESSECRESDKKCGL